MFTAFSFRSLHFNVNNGKHSLLTPNPKIPSIPKYATNFSNSSSNKLSNPKLNLPNPLGLNMLYILREGYRQVNYI